MSSDVLYVFNQQKELIGRLDFEETLVSFQYARTYVNNPQSLSLNPFYLPLIEGRVFKTLDLINELLCFSDCLPGNWGKAFLEGIYQRRLMNHELLLENQQDRIGHLIFSTTRDYSEALESDKSKGYIKEPIPWSKILKAKDEFERHHRVDSVLADLMKRGTSQGGARPKLSIIKGGEHYLAKLPSLRDYVNNQQIEHGTLKLAQQQGIDVAYSEIFNVAEGQDIFITKRFDYAEDQKRPYLSLASVCNIKTSGDASYLDFAEELIRLNGGVDLEQLYRRLVFNVLVSNHDDHQLNHAVYFKEGMWQLTPAFDVVAGEGQRRDQAIICGPFGRESSLRNVIGAASSFRLKEPAAKQLVNEMVENIEKTWETTFFNAGVSNDVIDSVRWAILNESIGHPH